MGENLGGNIGGTEVEVTGGMEEGHRLGGAAVGSWYPEEEQMRLKMRVAGVCCNAAVQRVESEMTLE